MVIHKNFSDFVLFLFIHMASADSFLHPTEEQVILEKMKKLYPHESDRKKKYETAVAEYNAVDKALILSLISDTFKFFDSVTFAQKYKIYTEMYDIINADGKVEETETAALESLKQIININAGSKHS
ncbi:MAG: TerB family tellurite resistance protein [Bacteroidetes bacterium]|nr:TerB family tellurite resistance protein [Bacteroidota bacterium]MBS1541190.1 TerB family tellurite resistance protein [Bacteroidota bacterium]